MNNKDVMYRQGRTKKQVKGNEKLAFASFAIMAAVVGVSIIISIINKLF